MVCSVDEGLQGRVKYLTLGNGINNLSLIFFVLFPFRN